MFLVDHDVEFPPGKLQVWVMTTDTEDELEDKVKLAIKTDDVSLL